MARSRKSVPVATGATWIAWPAEPEILGADCWDLSGFEVRYHCLFHHIILVKRGGLRWTYRGQDGEAKAGDLVYFSPAKTNWYATIGSTFFYQVGWKMGAGLSGQARVGFPRVGPLPVKLTLGPFLPACAKAFDAMCANIAVDSVGAQLRAKAGLYELMAAIADCVMSQPVNQEVEMDAWDRVRLHLSAPKAQRFHLDELAAELNVTVPHFVREFRRRYGVTPWAYFNDCRARHALHMLQKPGARLKEVAFNLGFSDAKSLTRLLDRTCGMVAGSRDKSVMGPDSGTKIEGRPYPVNRHQTPPGTPVLSLRQYIVNETVDTFAAE